MVPRFSNLSGPRYEQLVCHGDKTDGGDRANSTNLSPEYKTIHFSKVTYIISLVDSLMSPAVHTRCVERSSYPMTAARNRHTSL